MTIRELLQKTAYSIYNTDTLYHINIHVNLGEKTYNFKNVLFTNDFEKMNVITHSETVIGVFQDGVLVEGRTILSDMDIFTSHVMDEEMEDLIDYYDPEED